MDICVFSTKKIKLNPKRREVKSDYSRYCNTSTKCKLKPVFRHLKNYGGTMKKFKSISTILLVAAFIFSTNGASVTAASDQKERGERGYKGREFQIFKILHELNLSDEQKKEVSAVFKNYRDAKKSSFKTMIAARENLSKAIYSDEYNEAAVREAYRAVAAAGEEMAVLRAKSASGINAVLTPEQREKFKKLITARFNKIKEKIDSEENP